MAEKFDLNEYQTAIKVVKDIPKILKAIDNILPLVQEYDYYKSVSHLKTTIYEVRAGLLLHLAYYEKVLEDKGKIQDVKRQK
jgi:hypothetical protein